MVRRTSIEDHATLQRPSALALDPQEVATPEVNDQVIGQALAERDRHVISPLDERAEDCRLRLISPPGT